MILINVSFTEEFLKVTTFLGLRILNPKVDAFLTSFLFILGTLVGVKWPVEFFCTDHNEIIGGRLCFLKRSSLNEHCRNPRNQEFVLWGSC